MTNDWMLGSLYLLMALMLVAGSLIARRERFAKLATFALAWVAIFGAGFVLFTFRDDLGYVAQRLRAEASGEPVVAGQQHTAAHYFICFGVAGCGCFMRLVFEAGLAQYVTCKHGTCLNVPLLQEDLQVPADEGSRIAYGNSKCEPSCARIGQLFGQDHVLFKLAKELTQLFVIGCAGIYILCQFVQLYYAERSAHFRWFYVVARLFEHEFGVVRDAFYFYIETVLDFFRFYEQG